MRKRDIFIRLLLFGGTAYALWARPAFAIPVFARVYNQPCGARHSRVRRQLWRVTGGGQWLLLENLKFVAEVTYGENHEGISERRVPLADQPPVAPEQEACLSNPHLGGFSL